MMLMFGFKMKQGLGKEVLSRVLGQLRERAQE